MSRFFEHLADCVGSLRSSEQLHMHLAKTFGPPEQFLEWVFDPVTEFPAAQQLADMSVDLLIQSVYELNTYFLSTQRKPRRFASDYPAMKRVAADALAKRYPSGHPTNKGLRVAIFVPYLPNNPNNNILRVVAGYLAGLLRRGVDATLVVSNEFSHPTQSSVRMARKDARPYRKTLETVIGEYDVPASSLAIAPPPLQDEGNFEWHKSFQSEYKPNVVFVPNFEMSSVHVHGFGKSAASVYLQTSINNRPSYDFTRYLYLGGHRVIDASHLHPEKWFYHTFGYAEFGTGSNLARKDIGLPDQAFVVVTAGNRLENEINPEIISIMASLLSSRRDTVWMLLGVRDEQLLRRNLAQSLGRLQDRVICKGYVREIGDYLAMADIYANPRRTGGAVSMALAIYGHTPVISFVGSDACNFLIDEMMHASTDTYEGKLHSLASDRSLLRDIEKVQYARFAQGHTIDSSASDLLHHLHQALAQRQIQ
jgi:hypothetical protein